MGIGFLDALKGHESWVVVEYWQGDRREESFDSSSKAYDRVNDPIKVADAFVEKILGPDGQEYWNPYFTDGRKTWEELR